LRTAEMVTSDTSKPPLVSLIAGGTAGGVECAITYPFEFAKTRVQLREEASATGRPATRNPFAVIKRVIEREGVV
jgi:solute carrier family 25 (mitochondrial citrate transporter), member 1